MLFANRSRKQRSIPAAWRRQPRRSVYEAPVYPDPGDIHFGLAFTLLFPGYASGQPTTDIRAKAAQLEKDLNAANQQVAALGQQLQAAEAKVAEADARIKPIQDEINRIKSMINGRAASFYKFAGAAGPFDALNAQDANDLSARSKYGDVVAGNDDTLVQQLAAQRAELDKARAEAAANETQFPPPRRRPTRRRRRSRNCSTRSRARSRRS